MSVHTFVPRVSGRALAIAAVSALLGAVAVVLALSLDADWWAVPGGVLLVLGVALALIALLMPGRNRSRVELDERGWLVSNRTGSHRGDWQQVERVLRSTDGDRLTMLVGGGSPVHLVAPEASLDALAADIAQHLNRDRGYRNL